MKLKVVLLNDAPAKSDEFEVKAHDQVAKAISELSATEVGARVIGLEGEWGAGKSTVVGLVRTYFQNSSSEREGDRTLIVIDAWEHQGDKLRRAVLESLISQLEESNWLSKGSAANHRKRLSGRQSRERTSSTARLSKEGISASIATLALFIGATFYQHHYGSHAQLWHWIAAALMASPFLVFILFSVLHAAGATAIHFKREGPTWKKLSRVRAFSFFAQVQSAVTTTTSIESGEPTSVEFSETFCDVMKEALESDRRLMLVIDNLDRVESSDARHVLSTLQTFTSTLVANPDWGERVWILIPYDADGLTRIWSEASSDEDGADDGSHADDAVSTAFIDKVFQIRFSVPPQVLSDWRNHLRRLLETALPDAQVEDLQKIISVRAAYVGAMTEGAVAHETPTPRQLVQFVNQIGSVLRQRDDIPLSHVTYFTLLQRDGVPIATRLRDGSLPHSDLAHMFGPSIVQDLAALLYGSSPDLALQLLLVNQIDIALDSPDPFSLKELASRSGFFDAIEFVDISERASDGAVRLSRSLSKLQDASLLDSKEGQEWFDQFVKTLVMSVPEWMLADELSGSGVAVAFTRTTDTNLELQGMFNKISPTGLEGDASGSQHMAGLVGLLKGLIRFERISSDFLVNVYASGSVLVTNLSLLAKQFDDISPLGILNFTSDAKVAPLLAEAILTGAPDARNALDVLMLRQGQLDKQELAKILLDSMFTSDLLAQVQTSLVFDAINRCRKESVTALREASENGILMNALHVASQNAFWDSAAAAAMIQLGYHPEMSEPAVLRASALGAITLRQVLADPSSHPELSSAQERWLAGHPQEASTLIFDLAKIDAYLPWVTEQLRTLAHHDQLRITVSQLLLNLPIIKSALEENDLIRLTDELISDSDNVTSIAQSANPNALATAIRACASGSLGHDATPFIDAGRSLLQAQPKDNWMSVLNASSSTIAPLLDLAILISHLGSTLAPSTQLYEALHDHAKSLASGVAVWSTDAATFFELARAIGPDSSKVLAREIVGFLENRDGEIGPQFFSTYGDFLRSEASFRTHPQLPTVVSRLVAVGAWDQIDWFVSVSRDFPDIFDPSGRQSEIEHLKSIVDAALSERVTALPPALNDLAQALGVEPPKVEEVDSADKGES